MRAYTLVTGYTRTSYRCVWRHEPASFVILLAISSELDFYAFVAAPEPLEMDANKLHPSFLTV